MEEKELEGRSLPKWKMLKVKERYEAAKEYLGDEIHNLELLIYNNHPKLNEQIKQAIRKVDTEKGELLSNLGLELITANEIDTWEARQIERLAKDCNGAFPELENFSSSNIPVRKMLSILQGTYTSLAQYVSFVDEQTVQVEEALMDLIDSLQTFITNEFVVMRINNDTLQKEVNNLTIEKDGFKTFNTTKKKLLGMTIGWGAGLVFGAIGFIVWQLCKKRIGFEVTISDQWTLAAVILANLPFAWFFWFAITQFIKSRDLYDKYTFKENTIKFFQSIRQQHLDANDKDHYTSILNKSIDSIVSDPVEEINRKRSKALPTEDFIRMLDAINNFRTPPKS